MSQPHERLHAVVSGRVQGVGFRDFTQATAQRLGLAGWVRNQRAGTVEVTAEGPRAALDQLLAALQRGPAEARVAAIHSNWAPATGDFAVFEIQW